MKKYALSFFLCIFLAACQEPASPNDGNPNPPETPQQPTFPTGSHSRRYYKQEVDGPNKGDAEIVIEKWILYSNGSEEKVIDEKYIWGVNQPDFIPPLPDELREEYADVIEQTRQERENGSEG